MWKRFNARFRQIAGAAACAAACAGCDVESLRQDQDAQNTIEAQEAAALQSREAVPEPGLTRNFWRPADAATSRVTGKLTASLERGRSGPLALAFVNGITLRLERLSKGSASALAGGPAQASFASMFGVDDDALVFVYRVLSEDVERVAPLGGLCARLKTSHVAVVENPGEDGVLMFKIAAFTGQDEPGTSQSTDAKLCAVYSFLLT